MQPNNHYIGCYQFLLLSLSLVNTVNILSLIAPTTFTISSVFNTSQGTESEEPVDENYQNRGPSTNGNILVAPSSAISEQLQQTYFMNASGINSQFFQQPEQQQQLQPQSQSQPQQLYTHNEHNSLTGITNNQFQSHAQHSTFFYNEDMLLLNLNDQTKFDNYHHQNQNHNHQQYQSSPRALSDNNNSTNDPSSSFIHHATDYPNSRFNNYMESQQPYSTPEFTNYNPHVSSNEELFIKTDKLINTGNKRQHQDTNNPYLYSYPYKRPRMEPTDYYDINNSGVYLPFQQQQKQQSAKHPVPDLPSSSKMDYFTPPTTTAVAAAASSSKRSAAWTKSEEAKLQQLVDSGVKWHEITKEFPNRSAGAIKKHYYADMKNVPWTEEEDIMLQKIFKEHESWKWKEIGEQIGKPAGACRKRMKQLQKKSATAISGGKNSGHHHIGNSHPSQETGGEFDGSSTTEGYQ